MDRPMAKLFFSYSHKDEDLRDALETHLSTLRREILSALEEPVFRPFLRPMGKAIADEERAFIAQPSSKLCSLPRKQSRHLVLELLVAKGFPTDQLGNGLSPQNISKLILQRCPPRRIGK
jgi:hypothetical protein